MRWRTREQSYRVIEKRERERLAGGGGGGDVKGGRVREEDRRDEE